MKRLWILFCLLPLFALGQKGRDNLWMFGYYNGGRFNMDFASGLPVFSLINRQMNFADQSSTICDKSGNFLFYTNGVWIANTKNDTMLNGSGLSPSYWVTNNGWAGLYIPQSALILPDPADSMKYFVIHSGVDDSVRYPYYIYFSEIDMRLDSGRGAVTSKNNVIKNDTLVTGRITAVRHGNGRDWWIVFHKAKSDLYYISLLDPTGIQVHSTQNIGTYRSKGYGQVCFSPDGSKLAFYDDANDLDVMDFDRCSGVLSNNIHVSISDGADGGGCAFSANSKVLYVSSMYYVYQFRMDTTDIAASQKTVDFWDGSYCPSAPAAPLFYLSQLAPDGKIYMSSQNGVLCMHVINDPDIVGYGCNVCQHCISLPAYNAFTIPNHPNYHLGALKGSFCDSLGIGIEEIAEQNKISVYPNPMVGEEITFTYSSTGEAKTLRVFNVEGQEVAHYNVPQWSSVQHLKLPKLASGIYLARLTSGNQTSSSKFIVE